MDKNKLHPIHQAAYDSMSATLSPLLFSRWYAFVLYLADFEQSEWQAAAANYEAPIETTPEQPKVLLNQEKSNNTKLLIVEAREAVAGYSPSNGLRKAVEALADAVEGVMIHE